MKKVLYYIFIALLTINLTSCGSVPMFHNYAYTKGWALKEIPPSQAVRNGDVVLDGKLSDGRTFSVGGYIGGDDSTYYYNSLILLESWCRANHWYKRWAFLFPHTSLMP